MSSHTIEDLTSCILDFQANMIRVTYRRKTTYVDPVTEPSHIASLAYIWTSSRLNEEEREDGLYKWRKLGFNGEDLSQEFSEVGVLGLDCMVGIPTFFPRGRTILTRTQKNFVAKDPESFATVSCQQPIKSCIY